MCKSHCGVKPSAVEVTKMTVNAFKNQCRIDVFIQFESCTSLGAFVYRVFRYWPRFCFVRQVGESKLNNA